MGSSLALVTSVVKASRFILNGVELSAKVIFFKLVMPSQFCETNVPFTPAGTVTSVIEEQPCR